MTAFLLMWFWTAFFIAGLLMAVYGLHPAFAVAGFALGAIISSVVYMYRWFRQPPRF